MPIYTKTGDRGETAVFGGKRLPKDAVLIEALGSLDELNAALGLAVKETPELVAVQKDLMAICSRLAGYEIKLPETEKLEKEIDRMWGELPELSNFILPNSQLFWARAVARRAERTVIKSIKQLPNEAPRPDGREIFSPLLRRGRNPSEAENSSPSSSDSRPRFSAKGDKAIKKEHE